MHPQLILSSSSPARRMLLARLGLPFQHLSPDVDETPLPEEKTESLVLRLAELKARTGGKHYPDALIIGSDQVGILDNELLCKPLTHENAYKQLRKASGNKVRFLNGLCLFDARKNQCQLAIEIYDVYFRKLSDAMIENYLQKDKPYHCAGSFHAEGLGIALVDKFEGHDYTALIGLPLIRLVDMLEKAGVNII